MTEDEMAIRDRRKKRLSYLGVCLILGLAILPFAATPTIGWVMGFDRELHYNYIPALPTDYSGSYVITSKGVMQLYTWNMQAPDGFPEDSVAFDSGSVQELAVVQKQFDEVTSYQLWSFETNKQVPWQSWEKKGTQLFLQPALPLPPGRYLFIRSTDSPFGGETMHYFRIR